LTSIMVLAFKPADHDVAWMKCARECCRAPDQDRFIRPDADRILPRLRRRFSGPCETPKVAKTSLEVVPLQGLPLISDPAARGALGREPRGKALHLFRTMDGSLFLRRQGADSKDCGQVFRRARPS
jgi:hypothetical protein